MEVEEKIVVNVSFPSPRMTLQGMFATLAQGKIVNIGCAECPVDLGPNTVNVDIDKYDVPNFIRADAHELPFKDNEFDTAILGDMLEHVLDPVQVLREAGRVSKRVVATIFEEWRLPGVGQYIKEGQALGKKGIQEKGFDNFFDYMKNDSSYRPLVELTDDDKNPHLCHINQFDDRSIFIISHMAGLKILFYLKFVEQYRERDSLTEPMYNWLVVCEKKGENSEA